jgi:hypothetical protein
MNSECCWPTLEAYSKDAFFHCFGEESIVRQIDRKIRCIDPRGNERKNSFNDRDPSGYQINKAIFLRIGCGRIKSEGHYVNFSTDD